VERCIFCDIVRGQGPAERLFEDELTLAFLDINPVNPGHALVIPKEHHATLLDLPDRLMGPLGVTCRRLGAALLAATGAGGLNLMMNNYRVAGQLIDHVHFHLVPRHAGDGLRHWPGRRAATAELRAVAEKIRSVLE
jgi:histidine triad (HIT) family protein